MLSIISTFQTYRKLSPEISDEGTNVAFQKRVLIMDVALAALSMTAGTCIILAASGTNLGLLNVMGAVGTVCGGGLIGVGFVILTSDIITLCVFMAKQSSLYIQSSQNTKSQIDDLNGEKSVLTGQAVKFFDQNKELSNKNAELARLLNGHEVSNQDNSKLIEELRSKITMLEAEIAILKQTNSELIEELNSKKAEIATLNQTHSELTEELSSKRTEIVTLTSEKFSLGEKLVKLMTDRIRERALLQSAISQIDTYELMLEIDPKSKRMNWFQVRRHAIFTLTDSDFKAEIKLLDLDSEKILQDTFYCAELTKAVEQAEIVFRGKDLNKSPN